MASPLPINPCPSARILLTRNLTPVTTIANPKAPPQRTRASGPIQPWSIANFTKNAAPMNTANAPAQVIQHLPTELSKRRNRSDGRRSIGGSTGSSAIGSGGTDGSGCATGSGGGSTRADSTTSSCVSETVGCSGGTGAEWNVSRSRRSSSLWQCRRKRPRWARAATAIAIPATGAPLKTTTTITATDSSMSAPCPCPLSVGRSEGKAKRTPCHGQAKRIDVELRNVTESRTGTRHLPEVQLVMEWTILYNF